MGLDSLPLTKALFRMENAIHTLRIQNFKSIKDVTMQPRRVNLIIGMPNVGKSNILEAMSLLGAGLYDDRKIFLSDVLRYETISNLFYDNDTSQAIAVEASTGSAVICANDMGGNYRFVQVSDELWRQYEIIVEKEYPNKGNSQSQVLKRMAGLRAENRFMADVLKLSKVEKTNFSIVEANVSDSGEATGFRTDYYTPNALPKKYTYQPKQPHEHEYQFLFLKPPLGHNLLTIVQRSPTLRNKN